jgi:hypothetical protein
MPFVIVGCLLVASKLAEMQLPSRFDDTRS